VGMSDIRRSLQRQAGGKSSVRATLGKAPLRSHNSRSQQLHRSPRCPQMRNSIHLSSPLQRGDAVGGGATAGGCGKPLSAIIAS